MSSSSSSNVSACIRSPLQPARTVTTLSYTLFSRKVVLFPTFFRMSRVQQSELSHRQTGGLKWPGDIGKAEVQNGMM